jgi:hypothetical protein
MYPRFTHEDMHLFESDQARIDYVVAEAEAQYKQLTADAGPHEIVIPEEDFLENLWEQTFTWTQTLTLRGERITVYCLAWIRED